jgi:hypothetical protein
MAQQSPAPGRAPVPGQRRCSETRDEDNSCQPWGRSASSLLTTNGTGRLSPPAAGCKLPLGTRIKRPVRLGFC